MKAAWCIPVPSLFFSSFSLGSPVDIDTQLESCGDARYVPSHYTCYDGDFLCPVLNGEPTLRCGPDCYRPEMYSCSNNHLVYPPISPSATSTATALTCTATPSTFQLASEPYENYFYSDCHSSSQVVVTSPISSSNLTIIGPRLLVAWPAGNSGVVSYFEPENGVNGTLGIKLLNSTTGQPLAPVYMPAATQGGNATVGIRSLLELNSTAVLTVVILGSIRTIRDFVEGPSLLYPKIQDAVKYTALSGGGVMLQRLWLDNITTTSLSFMPASANQTISLNNKTIKFDAGNYYFNASFDYPQLTEFSPKEVLASQSQNLINQEPTQINALSFLSYTTKLTAGAWRFLTYFGRDSMISALLLDTVLSQGKDGGIEAVLAGVLERVNRTDGSVCHEETIGDYATWLNEQQNITSTEPLCSYIMIDSDLYLPVLMDRYFVGTANGSARAADFLKTPATILPANSNLTYGDLGLITAEKIMRIAAPFAGPGNQTIDNLIHLKDGIPVGEWRDSEYGIGGGRIPYDVNTALVPAALRSIASLSKAGLFPTHADWSTTAASYAQIWEDHTLPFFEVHVPTAEAKSRLGTYAQASGFNGSDQSSSLDDGSDGVTFHAVSLEGNNNQSQVLVMNSDDSFRHFLLNTTDQAQLTSFLNSTASNIRRRFPAGLMTDVGMLVANPAYGSVASPFYAANWSTNAYHGTVVWSWPLAMMAKGLERQLGRCDSTSTSTSTSNSTAKIPQFCSHAPTYANVKAAYNILWDSIEANTAHLTTEVWSWVFHNNAFEYVDLGSLPPPPGVNPTESDVVQLWSLTFLAVTRNRGLA